jgi:hypothetical protein
MGIGFEAGVEQGFGAGFGGSDGLGLLVNGRASDGFGDFISIFLDLIIRGEGDGVLAGRRYL